MKARPGRVTAKLAEPAETIISEDLIDLINQNIKPTTLLTNEDVHIRAMYIVSDQVNSFGGRFPDEELEKLVQLSIDSPVMVGHRKDKLPIGRNFHAEVLTRWAERWLKTYFYWLKKTDNGEMLQRNIDGGVYKECSIGFTFHVAECSICNQDIRTCEHEPFGRYKKSNQSEDVCHFNYRQIEKVLETSLVYRGAVRDTKVGSAFHVDTTSIEHLQFPTIEKIQSSSELKTEANIYVAPCYQGVWVTACKSAGCLQLSFKDGTKIDQSLCNKIDDKHVQEFTNVIGLLIGYRGKERCHPAQLERFLNKENSPVSRVELKLLPRNLKSIEQFSGSNRVSNVSTLRNEIVDRAGLINAIERMRTRDGVYIWSSNTDESPSLVYKLGPACKKPVVGKYLIYKDNQDTVIDLILNDGSTNCLKLPGVEINQIRPGRLYRVDQFNAKYKPGSSVQMKGRGMIYHFGVHSSGISMSIGGAIMRQEIQVPVLTSWNIDWE